MSSGADHGPAAHALAAAHAGYHAETRVHRPPDTSVDDVVSWSTLGPHLVRARLFLVAPTLLLLLYLILGYFLSQTSNPTVLAELIYEVTGFVTVVLYILGVAAFFAPAKEPIAEYSRLVEGRAAAAAAVQEGVRQAAQARQTPAEVTPSTVTGVPVLLFRQRSERAMLLVQPYGEDLYVGWTMWRSRSTMTLLAHFLRDTFGRFAPWPQFSAELRAAATRALRESVHSLAREGVAVVEAGAVEPSGAWSAQQPGPAAQQGERQHGEPQHGERRHGGRRHDELDSVYRPGPPQEHAAQGHRSGELPRSSPAADPTGGWTRRRDEVPVEREREPDPGEPVRRRGETPTTGEAQEWGPPPRDRW